MHRQTGYCYDNAIMECILSLIVAVTWCDWGSTEWVNLMNHQTQKLYPPFAFFYETGCVCLCVCGYDPQNSRYDDNTPYDIGDHFHPHPVSNGVDIDNLRPRNETEVRTT